ncbi:TetR/AcrR family transcriptional regulator [Thermoanaerobacterium sp. RBIITD]|uniref:TetR/AcrR family transcriptional regulator n=1 Tax=Thermoanaerobacterium sp. RBIITD TaxID=1550240 RepID=UPI000BB6BA9F|nr:TetR/AcrR family transcriptional regulator [Thermoanaerobacterium sp. RBIITD]SNX54249.1 transcriptional regulator, TetR family [Thermoanaerobacterium sp. RBIITD]
MDNDQKSTEEKIFESAVDLFCEKGFDRTTTSEIAKKAGVAEGTIFRYFKTKKDILSSIASKAMDILTNILVIKPINKIIKSNKKEEEIMYEILRDRYDIITRNFSIIKILGTEAMTKKQLRDNIVKAIPLKAIKMGEKFYKAGFERGVFRELPPRAVVRSFVGSLFMLIAEQQFLPDDYKSKDVDKELRTIVDIYMNGIKKKGE